MSFNRMRVEGFNHLVRDVNSNAIINTNKTEYALYMQRIKQRENESDKFKSAVREINNLKRELREIKELLKGVINK